MSEEATRESPTKIQRILESGDVKSECNSISIIDIIPQDLLRIIILDTLGIFSFYLLSSVCKAFRKLIPTERDFKEQTLIKGKERLLERLHAYPNQVGDILIRLLKEENAVIAGGYILQCITNDHFEDSDIDIFIPSDPSKRYDPSSYSEDLSIVYRRFNIVSPGSPFYNVQITDDTRYLYLDQMNHILKMEIYGIKIQFIFVFLDKEEKECKLSDYIKNKFDISLCKCWFDGESIESADLLAQVKRVGIMNTKNLKRVKERLDSFHTVIKNAISKKVERYQDVMNERIEKYTRRGFKVIEQ